MLDLIKKNYVELVKGVARTSTTTVGALRTAVTVAQAMSNQRLVLDQITALNTTTAKIIDATGAMLKDNTARIHEQAAASTIPMETLQRAFQNIYDTMDAVDTFKLKALDSMKTTITTLTAEVEKHWGRFRPTRPDHPDSGHTAVLCGMSCSSRDVFRRELWRRTRTRRTRSLGGSVACGVSWNVSVWSVSPTRARVRCTTR